MALTLKKIRFFFESLALRLGLLILPALPRRAIRLLALAAAEAACLCCRKLRRIASANLRIAFGGDISQTQLRRVTRLSFRTAALVMLDLIWFSRNTAARMARYVSVDPSLSSRLKSSQVIGVTAHFGNWELISSATAPMGARHTAVFAELKNPYITPFLYKLRNTPGVKIIQKQGAIGKLLKALRRGESIALLLDQNTLPQEGGIFVDFFGLPAPISGAAGLLSERTGIPVMVVFCMLRPDGTYYLYSLPEIKPCDFSGGTEKDPSQQNIALAITRAIANAFEQEIAKHPEQWQWTYKRWKFIAPGSARANYPFYSRSF